MHMQLFDLMVNLHSDVMRRIKREFAEHENAVDLVDFLGIMERNLPAELEVRVPVPEGHTGAVKGAYELIKSKLGRTELVEVLIDLFYEVDINGDAVVEWDEVRLVPLPRTFSLTLSWPFPSLPSLLSKKRRFHRTTTRCTPSPITCLGQGQLWRIKKQQPKAAAQRGFQCSFKVRKASCTLENLAARNAMAPCSVEEIPEKTLCFT